MRPSTLGDGWRGKPGHVFGLALVGGGHEGGAVRLDGCRNEAVCRHSALIALDQRQ